MDSGESTEEGPVPANKGKSQIPGKRKASALKQKSVAEVFFKKKKKIAGFDHPWKALYTTVRELVENALDSAESIGELPSIEVTIEENSRRQLSSVTGQIDEIQLGKKVKKTKRPSFYRVTCKDNGRGMSSEDILDMFGGVESGKECGVKRTRGKPGLGANMALIWSKMSTGIPIEISTSMKDQDDTLFCSLDIDMDTNIPRIQLHDQSHENKREKWHGAEITVGIGGEWTGYWHYRLKILKYMRGMAVITPCAEITFRYLAEDPDDDVDIRIERMSATPSVVGETTPSDGDTSDLNLFEFLQRDLVNIEKADAERLIGEIMGPDFTSKTPVNSLTVRQFERIVDLFQKAAELERLIPVGEENLRLGIMGALKPEKVATYTERVQVSGGHHLIVEAGVGIGGDRLRGNLNIYRFANRVQLVLDDDADAVANATRSFNWRDYRINPKSARVGVFVSIVSTTKIPFKGKGMECIIDSTGTIARAVKICLKKCCSQLEPQLRNPLEIGSVLFSTLKNYAASAPEGNAFAAELLQNSQLGKIPEGQVSSEC